MMRAHRLMLSVLSALSAAALLVTTTPASALDVGSEGSAASVEIHAFASQGFVLTTGNNYLAAKTKNGSFQFSEVGINFTKSVTDRLRLGVQLYAQNMGPLGTYNARMDWFYLDYRLFDWLGFRAGRVKIPFGLYNEINDVDSGRNSVLLPQSVYPLQNRQYLLAQTGFELYGYAKTRSAGALDYRVYAGTIFFDTAPLQTGGFYTLRTVTTPYVVGARLLWETPLDGLRVGGSVQALRLDADIDTPQAAATPVRPPPAVSVEIPVTLGVASVEYTHRDLLLAAEYSRWMVKINSNNPAILPSSPVSSSERGYGMVAYRVSRWLQPGAYYSLLFPDTDNRHGREHVQHDVATTLRFDITSFWLVKLEAHYMYGTAALSSAINSEVPLASLDRSWEAYFIKTTGYF